MENTYHGYFLLPQKFSSVQLNIWNPTANKTKEAIIPSWYFDIPEAKQKKVKYIPVGPRNVPKIVPNTPVQICLVRIQGSSFSPISRVLKISSSLLKVDTMFLSFFVTI
jgi:hypothetical protein